MRREAMEYSVEQERLLYENEMELVDCHYTEDADDLKLAKGIFNGFIIELFAAAFVIVIIAVI
jgi:hypothetical protein